jgi:hypothetical protein
MFFIAQVVIDGTEKSKKERKIFKLLRLGTLPELFQASWLNLASAIIY